MPQTAPYQQFPLVTPIIRLVTHRFAPLAALILVVVVALGAAIVTFGLVALTMLATAMVVVVSALLIAVAGH